VQKETKSIARSRNRELTDINSREEIADIKWGYFTNGGMTISLLAKLVGTGFCWGLVYCTQRGETRKTQSMMEGRKLIVIRGNEGGP
jgi:hypothetical protein